MKADLATMSDCENCKWFSKGTDWRFKPLEEITDDEAHFEGFDTAEKMRFSLKNDRLDPNAPYNQRHLPDFGDCTLAEMSSDGGPRIEGTKFWAVDGSSYKATLIVHKNHGCKAFESV